jgi:hypothetical protein
MTEPRNSVEEWFLGKSDEDLQAIERGGRTFYPETIKRKDPGDRSKLIETPVYLAVPSTTESINARREAFKLARQYSGDDSVRTGDTASAVLGPDLWTELQMFCTLAESIYTRDKEPRQYLLAEFLIKETQRGSAWDLYDRLTYYARVEDPRLSTLSPAGFIKLVRLVAERRNCSPLVAIDGVTRDAFIVTMASQLATSLT